MVLVACSRVGVGPSPPPHSSFAPGSQSFVRLAVNHTCCFCRQVSKRG